MVLGKGCLRKQLKVAEKGTVCLATVGKEIFLGIFGEAEAVCIQADLPDDKIRQFRIWEIRYIRL
jgi:hypothetical protein